MLDFDHKFKNKRQGWVLIIFLLLSSLMYSSIATAQTKEDQEIRISQLESLVEVLDNQWFLRTLWSLGYKYGEEKDTPKPPSKIISDIEEWLQRRGGVKNAERQLMQKHQGSLNLVFRNLELIGDELGRFFYIHPEIPISFANKNGSIALVITGVGSKTTYNTLRTTPRSRASKIIQSRIVPSLKRAYGSLSRSADLKALFFSDIKHVGMSVVYGSEDFSKRGEALNLRAEVVCFVVTSDQLTKFLNSEITEDELVDKAEIYLSDRDMVTGIKKIKVSLE